MAIYDYFCKCGATRKDYVKSVNAGHPKCRKCNRKMRVDFGSLTSNVYVFEGGVDFSITGQPIPYNSKRDLKNKAARHGVHVE